MNEIEQTYGKLKEGLHIVGYTFERTCTSLTWLLQQGRWKRCGDGFKDINTFIGSLSMEEFKIVAEQRKKIATMIKSLQPKASNRAIAKALNVGSRTVDRDVAPNGALGGKKSRKIKGGNGATAPNGAPLSGVEAAKVVARAERVATQQDNVSKRVADVAFEAAKIGKFSLILADPPWDDEFGPSNRSIENHYPTMSLEQICALRVSDIAYDKAMLFLWATPSMLEMAFAVVSAWGFEYRTQMVWVKPSIGLGKYVRQRHEILLICRRGEHPAPDPTALSDSVIEAERGEHSAKPSIFHDVIERMYPEAERIELFRRGNPRKGWSAWGNQLNKVVA